MTEPDTQIVTAAIAREVPLTALRAPLWNPRMIRSERFKNLMRSIETDPDFLRLRPVLAQANGDIYAGSQRWLASAQLRRPTIWAIMEDVSEQLARERNLRDNGHWGEWDQQKLDGLLADLREMNTDLDVLGFTDKELRNLFTDEGNRLPEPGDQEVDETERLFGVVVTCRSEEEQVQLLERLADEGFDVRALVS